MDNKTYTTRKNTLKKSLLTLAVTLTMGASTIGVSAKQSLNDFQLQELRYCNSSMAKGEVGEGYIDCHAFTTLRTNQWLEATSKGEDPLSRKKRDVCADQWDQCRANGGTIWECNMALILCDNPGDWGL